MTYILGIDGGGSKTVCLLINRNAQILSRGSAGASNYHTVGKESAFQAIQSAIQQAVSAYSPLTISGIGLGLAGVARPSDFQVVQEWLQQLQASPLLPLTWQVEQNTVITHDALIALVGGIGKPVGIVVNAGTGAIIFGQNQAGKTQRFGGWGYLLGDVGSASSIALAGLQAALKAYDGIGIPTRLTEDFQQHLGLDAIADLVRIVYTKDWTANNFAALAPLVDNAAFQGDAIAQNIITQAVFSLVQGTQVVRNFLFTPDDTVEIVTTGSVWQGLSGFREQYIKAIKTHLPSTSIVQPCYEPAYGAGLLVLDTFNS